ncbi:MAG: hypothetical protein WBW93_15060 [Steroidobacteraceae bacterium]
MTWKNVQLPLSSDEVRQILENSNEDAVLVGGQALALWSQIYHVRPPHELSGGISADIDFIGSVSAAKTLGRALNRSGGSWKLHEVDPDDATPQTAKLSLTVKDEGYKEIDFLWAIVGVNTDQVKTRAVEMRLPGLSRGVKIIHPLDLLTSRLQNLAHIPEKRDAQGVAQGRLAISVVRAFISQAHRTRTSSLSAGRRSRSWWLNSARARPNYAASTHLGQAASMRKLPFSSSCSLRPQLGRLHARKPSIVLVVAVLAGMFILTLPPSAKADCKWIGSSPSWNHYYNGRLGT